MNYEMSCFGNLNLESNFMFFLALFKKRKLFITTKQKLIETRTTLSSIEVRDQVCDTNEDEESDCILFEGNEQDAKAKRVRTKKRSSLENDTGFSNLPLNVYNCAVMKQIFVKYYEFRSYTNARQETSLFGDNDVIFVANP